MAQQWKDLSPEEQRLLAQAGVEPGKPGCPPVDLLFAASAEVLPMPRCDTEMLPMPHAAEVLPMPHAAQVPVFDFWMFVR